MIIWKLPIRIIHWLVAIPVLTNFFLEGEDLPHKIVGYIAFSSVLIRILLGFIFNDHSSFKNFPLSFKKVIDYLKNKKETDLGHNPLASWIYIFIWLLVLSLGVSGYMMGLDAFWGEDWVEDLHKYIANTLYFLVGIHIIGIIFDSIRNKRKTWMGMINGKKQAPP